MPLLHSPWPPWSVDWTGLIASGSASTRLVSGSYSWPMLVIIASQVLVIINNTRPIDTVDLRRFSIFCINCFSESIVTTPESTLDLRLVYQQHYAIVQYSITKKFEYQHSEFERKSGTPAGANSRWSRKTRIK